MPCDVIERTDGTRVILCSRRRGGRRRRCAFCDAPAQYECDGSKPRKKSGTCDKPLCKNHRHFVRRVDDGDLIDTVDHCPECHAKEEGFPAE